MILGSREFIDLCRRERKLFGGGMRQAGIIAAAGLYAVKNNIHRLADDHANAKFLAESLDEFKLFTVDMKRVQTNIVLADITGEHTADEVLAKMKEVGVWGVPFGVKRIRMVTHLDVDRGACEEAVARMKKIFT
jgi:threonine aldolase